VTIATRERISPTRAISPTRIVSLESESPGAVPRASASRTIVAIGTGTRQSR